MCLVEPKLRCHGSQSYDIPPCQCRIGGMVPVGTSRRTGTEAARAGPGASS